MYLKSDYFFQE